MASSMYRSTTVSSVALSIASESEFRAQTICPAASGANIASPKWLKMHFPPILAVSAAKVLQAPARAAGGLMVDDVRISPERLQDTLVQVIIRAGVERGKQQSAGPSLQRDRFDDRLTAQCDRRVGRFGQLERRGKVNGALSSPSRLPDHIFARQSTRVP